MGPPKVRRGYMPPGCLPVPIPVAGRRQRQETVSFFAEETRGTLGIVPPHLMSEEHALIRPPISPLVGKLATAGHRETLFTGAWIKHGLPGGHGRGPSSLATMLRAVHRWLAVPTISNGRNW